MTLLNDPTTIARTIPSPDWGPIGEVVYKRTYSRPLYAADGTLEPWVRPEWLALGDGQDETWEQTVARVVDGNLDLARVVDGNLDLAPAPSHRDNEAADLDQLIGSMRLIPGGRHLWSTGTTVVSSRNCHRASFSERNASHYERMMTLLMFGGGVGTNYSDEYLARCRPILGSIDLVLRCDEDHPDFARLARHADNDRAASLTNPPTADTYLLVVGDSREGWAEALGYLFDLAERPGQHTLVVDIGEIRPFGSRLKTAGGTASGPGPLAELLTTVAHILNDATGRRLDSMDAMRADHAVAASVLAGGKRRSARLAMKHWADPGIFDFIHCKSDLSAMWTANISVEIDQAFFDARNDPADPLHDHAETVFAAVIDGMIRNGEPGFANTALAAVGERGDVRCFNPCAEIALEEGNPELDEDQAAGEACNLVQINLALFAHDPAGAITAFEMAGRYAYRATLAQLNDPQQQRIEQRNRRIGVGFMGFAEWLIRRGVHYADAATDLTTRHLLNEFRRAVRRGADELADSLGLPRSIKVTAVAPTGTTAKLPGTTSSMQPLYARYYLNRVRYTQAEFAAMSAADMADVAAVADDPNTPGVIVVARAVMEPIVAEAFDESLCVSQDELSIDQLLAVQAMVQETFCAGTDGNAISFTANIGAHVTDDELAAAFTRWLPQLKGTTVFPDISAAKAEEIQAPLQRITRDQFIEYGGTVGQAEEVCAGNACPIR